VVVCSHEPQCGLVLGRRHVLQPEQVERFQFLAKLGRLDRGEPVVCVVQ
jgi:hypothetical protein